MIIDMHVHTNKGGYDSALSMTELVAALEGRGLVSGIHKVSNLRRIADEMGGFLIGGHPFRRFFALEELGLKPKRDHAQALEEAIASPILDVVDEIEVLNSCCTERENNY